MREEGRVTAVSTCSHQGYIPALDPSLRLASTLYIVDQSDRTRGSPVKVGARTVVVAVSSVHYKDFRKVSGVPTLYMPPWTLGELQAARDLLHIPLDDATLQARVHEVGGVPRHVLHDDIMYHQAVGDRNAAVHSLDPGVLRMMLTSPGLAYVGGPRQEDIIMGTVICYHSSPPFTKPVVDFVSPNFKLKAARLVRRVWAASLMHSVHEADPAMVPWAELAFQEYALAKLMDGGTFRTATLTSPVASRGAPSMTTLPWADPGDAVDACTLKRTSVKLTVVASPGAGPAGLCSDSTRCVQVGYHMTIHKQWDVDSAALREVVAAMGATATSQATIYIVVPAARFAGWCSAKAPHVGEDVSAAIRLFVLTILV